MVREYRPRLNDLRIQEIRANLFYIDQYDGRVWHRLSWSDEPELVQHLVSPPFQCVGENECEGKTRKYYRWAEAHR